MQGICLILDLLFQKLLCLLLVCKNLLDLSVEHVLLAFKDPLEFLSVTSLLLLYALQLFFMLLCPFALLLLKSAHLSLQLVIAFLQIVPLFFSLLDLLSCFREVISLVLAVGFFKLNDL